MSRLNELFSTESVRKIRGSKRFRLMGLLTLASMVPAGCQTINAVPVSRVPAEILSTELKDNYKDISLLRLRQDPPDTYLLGPGDVLGVYIKGVLGSEEELPPVHYPEDSNRPPAIGYPVPIREDGTLALPIVDPINVKNMSLVEATEAVRNAYTYPREIVKKGEESIIVTLIQSRKVRVQVIREEAGGTEGVSKRGTGKVVDLPAYENDVLHALNETGGMPGTDAKNEILIYRGLFQSGVEADTVLNQVCQSNCDDDCLCNEAPLPDPPNVTRIPLRYNPANPPSFNQNDIILNDGDIIIIRSRDRETFTTAGVLGGGEYPLPRDKDLDILGAIALARGPLGQSGTGVGAIGGNGNGGGGGGGGGGRGSVNCQPSEAIIVRELPCGSSIAMKVDLNRALENPSERVLIQPNDVVLVRYTLAEEVGNVLLNAFQINYLLGSGINN
ncbi:MAG: sugar ABC transporter substrate-binding protein [Planctomycetota bacterium]|nr:MAG: sugar ABC transporter substrate-binding protein [Planctomycetota bacterium]